MATSGIIVTSDPVRERIISFTRFMSAATSAVSGSISRSGALSPNATTCPNVPPSLVSRAHSTIKTTPKGRKRRAGRKEPH